MVERLIRISPDGKEIIFLYDDQVPWADLGKMQCSRASDVVFDEEKQAWKIVFPNGKVVGYFTKRESAIHHEIFLLEGALAEDL